MDGVERSSLGLAAQDAGADRTTCMAVTVDPIDLEISARLRVLREWRGKTLTRLARALGADPLELGRYEAGAAPVSLLVEALGAPRTSSSSAPR